MKPLTIVPCVSLLALALLNAPAVHAQPAASSAKAELSVNDPNAVGAVGDGVLSLDEAVRLANGTLALDKLSAPERAQVKGAPGPQSRDLISLTAGATLTTAMGAAISSLVGNDGDTIDGNSAMLLSAESGKGVGLKISSGNFTLRNFQARGFATAVDVDFGGRALTNVSLEKLHLLGATYGSALLTVGAQSSNGSLHGLTIADSVFDTGEDVKRANQLFIAAARTPPGGTVDNVVLENVQIVRNRFQRGGLGLYLTGSMGAGQTRNAVTRNALVADNIFVDQHDAAINLLGGLPAADGRHIKVGLENVVARGNRLDTPNWGFYMGNELFGRGGPGAMTENFLRNITVEKNIITKSAKGSVGHCVSLENAADFRGDQASSNLVENIKIADNDISGCVEMTRPGRTLEELGAGVIINAGRPSISHENPGGIARNNVIRNVQVINNRIKDSQRGIVLNGGYNRFLGTAPDLSIATGNSLTGLRIEGNQLTNNVTGIRMTGGDGPAGATVTGNSVTDVRVQGNRITGSKIPCEAIANAGSATGNILNARCPTAPR